MTFITIEGIDGSGKTSLISSLQDRLTDLDPVYTKEPTSSSLGTLLRDPSIQKNPIAAAFLFLADRSVHLETEILPDLKDGRIIICDRYMDSQIAYQSVMLDGLMLDPGVWLRRSHVPWVREPDLTILLDLPAEEAMERIGFRTALEVYETEDRLKKIRQNYLELYQNRGLRKWLKVDARLDPGDVVDVAEDAIRKRCRRPKRV